MTPELVDEVEKITEAMIHQATWVQQNIAVVQNIGSLNTRSRIKTFSNWTLTNDNEYILKITKSLRIVILFFPQYLNSLQTLQNCLIRPEMQ